MPGRSESAALGCGASLFVAEPVLSQAGAFGNERARTSRDRPAASAHQPAPSRLGSLALVRPEPAQEHPLCSGRPLWEERISPTQKDGFARPCCARAA